MMAINSSVLYAAFNPAVRQYTQARAFFRDDKSPRILPDVVLTEVAYLMWQRAARSDVDTFLFAINSPQFQRVLLLPDDIERVRSIRAIYDTANFDFVDCCLMAISERLNITRICTFDRRDFAMFRPKHCDYFNLEP